MRSFGACLFFAVIIVAARAFAEAWQDFTSLHLLRSLSHFISPP